MQKKHLRFTALRESAAENFASVADNRGANSSYSIESAMLSGLACMYFQHPSLLDYQRKMRDRSKRHNLQSMFNVSNIPSDTGMKTIIDGIDSEEAFRPIYKDFFHRLQRGKHLEQYQVLGNRYLLNVDGTQYFKSKTVSCSCCLVRGQKGHEYNCHQVVQGAVVKPGLSQVIPVMPEEIRCSDGESKDDCETNSFKRFLDKFRQDHDKLKVIINADALYAVTPVINHIKSHHANYIFRSKDAMHKTLVSEIKARDMEKVTIDLPKGASVVIEWSNDVLLFKTTSARTNYFEARKITPQKDGSNKVAFLGKWITDIDIDAKIAKEVLDCARARWKIENECFNNLKNHGYEVEHNYGHGNNNLCYNFYNFTLLSFTMHQIHQLTDVLFQELRVIYGRLDSLWNAIKAFVGRLYFAGLEELWEFLASEGDYEPPPA